MNRKSICFIVPSLGTARVFLLNHIKELNKHFDIYLVTDVQQELLIYFKDVPLKEIKHIPIPRNIALIKDIKAFFKLRTYFKMMHFDAIHTVTPKAGLTGNLAAKITKIPKRIHIFTGQVWHTKKGFYKKILMDMDRFTVWNATHILVDGQSQRQYLIENKIIKPSHSFVLGKGSISGVNPAKFYPDARIRKENRKKLSIEENEVVFMFLGRMNRDKGINELAEAFNKIREEHENARLLLAGGDEENMTPIIKNKIKDENAIIFHDVTPTPELLLQACDVFCMPSYREGFGLSVIEASLMQKPIICSDTYGLKETIVEGRTGLRHKVADVDTLYDAMKKLMISKELRELLGTNGRDYILENFSAQLITEKWVEFYQEKIFG